MFWGLGFLVVGGFFNFFFFFTSAMHREDQMISNCTSNILTSPEAGCAAVLLFSHGLTTVGISFTFLAFFHDVSLPISVMFFMSTHSYLFFLFKTLCHVPSEHLSRLYSTISIQIGGYPPAKSSCSFLSDISVPKISCQPVEMHRWHYVLRYNTIPSLQICC